MRGLSDSFIEDLRGEGGLLHPILARVHQDHALHSACMVTLEEWRHLLTDSSRWLSSAEITEITRTHPAVVCAGPTVRAGPGSEGRSSKGDKTKQFVPWKKRRPTRAGIRGRYSGRNNGVYEGAIAAVVARDDGCDAGGGIGCREERVENTVPAEIPITHPSVKCGNCVGSGKDPGDLLGVPPSLGLLEGARHGRRINEAARIRDDMDELRRHLRREGEAAALAEKTVPQASGSRVHFVVGKLELNENGRIKSVDHATSRRGGRARRRWERRCALRAQGDGCRAHSRRS